MLSAVIIAKDEEATIEKLVGSLSFCDEVVVIDNNSSDQTEKWAKAAGAIVYEDKTEGDFSHLRNYGLEKAQGDWILFVDADETVSKELAGEIKQVIDEKKSINVYAIKRRDFFWGKELNFGEPYSIAHQGIIRLIKKGTGSFEGRVHETFKTTEQIAILKNHLLHNAHSGVADFLKNINHYSTIRAHELFERKEKVTIFHIVFFPIFKFIYTFFLRLGFRDGPAGFVYCFLMSFHSYLVRTKLYLLYQK